MLFLLTGCIGLNVNAVPTQDIYADDRDTKEYKNTVQFAVVGGVPAQHVTRVSDAELAVVSPAGAAGAVDVIVRNQDGLQAKRFAGYTYDAPTSAAGGGGGGGGGGGCSAAAGAASGAGAAGAIAPWLTLLAGLAILRRRARAHDDSSPVLRG